MASMIKRLWNDRRGVSAWVVTVAMVPLLGMVSLGTEVGSWHVTRRHAQNAADAAAFAGATALAVNDPTGPDTAGQAFANSNGFVNRGAQAVSITRAGNRVTAVVAQNEKAIFSQWFFQQVQRTRARPTLALNASRYRPQQLPKYKQNQGTVCSHSIR